MKIADWTYMLIQNGLIPSLRNLVDVFKQEAKKTETKLDDAAVIAVQRVPDALVYLLESGEQVPTKIKIRANKFVGGLVKWLLPWMLDKVEVVAEEKIDKSETKLDDAMKPLLKTAIRVIELELKNAEITKK